MSEDVKRKITFYRSFYESIKKFPSAVRLPLYEAITAFGFDLVEPDFSGVKDKYRPFIEAVWDGIRPQLWANHQRWLNGSDGGAPEGNQNARKQPRNNLETTEKQPNIKKNRNEKDNIESVEASPSAGSLKRFVKPTLEEVEDYCNSRGNGVDASAFFDFYESKGWKVGNQPMKDWRASVRTWERKNSSSKPQPQPDQGREENEDIYSAYDF